MQDLHLHLHHLHHLLLLLLLIHSSSGAVHHRIPFSTTTNSLYTTTNTTTPTLYFEVTKPISHPPTKPCSYNLLHHDFAYTYTKPPVTVPYTPPSLSSSSSTCQSTQFSTIVLEWKATSIGRQFDRLFGVWLGGVELLRSCTAEPRATGIVWSVQKDVTKYYSLLMQKNLTLAVYLGNLVDSTYTGIYHVDIDIHFYPFNEDRKGNDDPWADLILPITRELPLNDGLWYEIENSTDVEGKEVVIPRNVYRAVLEVYIAPQQNDEFWYSNYPNEYITANNLTGTPGNGPFREVIVSLDGEVVGAVWPFTVIYTGGINPLLWRPITGIGSFDLPTYDIEITPYLERLLDGKTHSVGFSVTNALNAWYVDANLHLWIDKKSKTTEAKLLETGNKPLRLSSKLDFQGLDGTFLTKATRTVSSSGWVKSSYGNITTVSSQTLKYVNLMVMANDANLQTVNQTIRFNTDVSAKKLGNPAVMFSSHKTFPLYLYTNEVAATGGGYDLVTKVDFAFDEERIAKGMYGKLKSSLINAQNALGQMVVQDNLVVGGVGTTKQTYKFVAAKDCYLRNVGCSNYTILYDQVKTDCTKEAATATETVMSNVTPMRYQIADYLYRHLQGMGPSYGDRSFFSHHGH